MAKESQKEEKTVITREKLTETVLFYLKEGLKRDLILILFPGLPVAFLAFLLIPKPYGVITFVLLAALLALCVVLYSVRVKGVHEGKLTVRKELVRRIVPGKYDTVLHVGAYSFSLGKEIPVDEVASGSAYYLVFLNRKTKHVFLYYKAKQYRLQ